MGQWIWVCFVISCFILKSLSCTLFGENEHLQFEAMVLSREGWSAQPCRFLPEVMELHYFRVWFMRQRSARLQIDYCGVCSDADAALVC